MAVSGDNSRQSLIPNFLYTSSVSPLLNHGGFRRISHPPMLNHSNTLLPSPSVPANHHNKFMIPAPDEPIRATSYEIFVAYIDIGVFGSGIPRMLLTPLDLVKCNMQIHPDKLKGILFGIEGLLKEQGVRGLYTGWVPTLVGYSVHGACRIGFFHFFNKYYSDIVGPEYAAKYRNLIGVVGSVSAEAIATVALCPIEAVKVRIQTQPGFARGLRDGLPKFIRSEGALGLYKGLVPLLGRQIPYAMMRFATFQRIDEMLYKYWIRKPENECSVHLRLGVCFAAGKVSGVLCAIVSHPADTLFSFLNNSKGATLRQAVKKFGVRGIFTRGLLLRMIYLPSTHFISFCLFALSLRCRIILCYVCFHLILRILTLSAAISCILSQLFYIKENSESSPYVSIVMLAVQAVGYGIPLVTGAEAIFKKSKTYDDSSVLEKSQMIQVIDYTVKLLVLVSFSLTLRLYQKVWRSRVRILSRAPPEPNRVPSDRRVFIVTTVVHVLGFVCVLMVHKVQPWLVELEEYSGLVKDFFLLPQVIGNLIWQIDCVPLRKSYFIGLTVIQLLPHVYDYIRSPIPNPYFAEEYEFVDPRLDFYSRIGDISIPVIAVLLAVFVLVQQRLGYEKLARVLDFGKFRVLPRRSVAYERLPPVVAEAEMTSGVDGNGASRKEVDIERV